MFTIRFRDGHAYTVRESLLLAIPDSMLASLVKVALAEGLTELTADRDGSLFASVLAHLEDPSKRGSVAPREDKVEGFGKELAYWGLINADSFGPSALQQHQRILASCAACLLNSTVPMKTADLDDPIRFAQANGRWMSTCNTELELYRGALMARVDERAPEFKDLSPQYL
jgi:hypothetical protein